MNITTHPDFWLGVSRALIILLTIFLAWVTYQSNLLLKYLEPNTNVLLSLPESVVRILLVGGCLLLAWLSGLPATQLGLVVSSFGWSLTAGAIIGIIILVLVNLTTYGAIRLFGRNIYSPWVIQNILPRRPSEWLWVPLALIPAVAMEEVLFRSLWLGGFGDIIPLPVLVVGISIVFGLMHLPQGVLGITLAGILNVVLSLLFLRVGELMIPLVAHYTFNVLQVVAAHFQRDWLENY